MYLTDQQSRALSDSFRLLATADDFDQLREQLAAPVSCLLQADSIVARDFDPATEQYSIRVAHNMDPAHASTYDDYYQFCDPVTPALRPRVCASFSQVFTRKEFLHTEFYNDFLRVHEIYWGLNLYSFDRQRCVGDLLVFRNKSRLDFDDNDLEVLRLLEPALTGAYLRLEHRAKKPAADGVAETRMREKQLTKRESDVALLASRGLTDKEIARSLHIERTTVRYYLTHALRKLEIKGRSGLAFALLHAEGPIA